MDTKHDDRRALVLAAIGLAIALLGPMASAWAVGVEVDTEDDVSSEQTADEETSGDGQATRSSGGAGHLSKLQVFGFMTQAYAEADFQDGGFPLPDGRVPPTVEEIDIGIPEAGTTNYRFIALQFRYSISQNDTLIFQFSSRALGASPVEAVEEEVELDWAFYQRRFGDNTSIKIGRIPIAIGIYNEIRDVGTILPFYRPAFVFYREGSGTTESVDGVNFFHQFFADSDWNLSFDIYLGEWDSFDTDIVENVVIPSRIEDAWGTWLWLNTPINGVRFGLGTQSVEVTRGAGNRTSDNPLEIDELYLSLEAAFNRFEFRAEGRNTTNKPTSFPSPGEDDFEVDVINAYVQTGFRFNSKFAAFLQWEWSDFELISPTHFTETVDLRKRTDLGLSLTYSFTPSLVLKAEYHETGGEAFTFMPIIGPPRGFVLQPIIKELDEGSYSIVSLSVSF